VRLDFSLKKMPKVGTASAGAEVVAGVTVVPAEMET
jgi:hypothetical protein